MGRQGLGRRRGQAAAAPPPELTSAGGGGRPDPERRAAIEEAQTRVGGVVADAFRPSTPPSLARRRRFPSINLSRRLPSRSRSAVFSARWHSIIRAWCSPNHIPIEAARNCSGRGSGSDFSAVSFFAVRPIRLFYAPRSGL
jgi:hypothetical protein